MKKGKLIVIEGTDCSGKETQSKLLVKKLNDLNEPTFYASYPNYETPTGKIIGLPLLGKYYLSEKLVKDHAESIQKCVREELNDEYDEKVVEATINATAKHLGIGWFPETAPSVDPKISSAFFAIDRAYNRSKIDELLAKGNVVLDRYVYSAMAHQGGKIAKTKERREFYEWEHKLEFEMFGLPEDDIRIFLHMPTKYTELLKKRRVEELDENEKNSKHLLDAEKSFLELSALYDFKKIKCIKKESNPISFDDIKTPEEIHEEICQIILEYLNLG